MDAGTYELLDRLASLLTIPEVEIVILVNYKGEHLIVCSIIHTPRNSCIGNPARYITQLVNSIAIIAGRYSTQRSKEN